MNTAPSSRTPWQAHRALALAGLLSAALSPGQAQTLDTVSVTAAPLEDSPLESAQPVSSLRGVELERRRAGSIADTVDRLPGVSSSGFGTAASRPVIRGQGGARVSVTENGSATLDASSISPDHAVSVDPLSVRQIDVIRGPATLMLGSGAIGGVVNALTDLIPSRRYKALSGEALIGGDTAARERMAAVRLRGPGPGSGGLNWSLGGFGRSADDYAIPGYAVLGDPASARGRLPNSFSDSRGFSGGASWVSDRVTAGLSYSTLDSHYGIPSEPDVHIDLRNHRTEGLVDLFEPIAGVDRLRLKAADVRYRHQEIERPDNTVGTAFDSRGRDLRLEAFHAPLGPLRGILGLHSQEQTLTAQGNEAYIPSAREQEQALFWVAELPLGPGRIDFGLREARARRTPTDGSGLAARRFDLNSWSLGGVLPLGGPVSLTGHWASTERAPALGELYALGAHAATATWEIGNPALEREQSRNLDLALRGSHTTLQWKAGVFWQRFARYTAAFGTDANGDGIADRTDDTGAIVNSPADPGAGELTRIAWQQAGAQFRGLEAELVWRPRLSPWSVRGFGDAVRGSVDGLGNAPRLPPLRIGASVDYRSGPWSGFVSALHAARQDRPSVFESDTPGYTRIDAEWAHTWTYGNTVLTAFAQVRNLLNEDIRLSTSFIRDVAPMPGRTVWFGLRARL